MLDQFWVQFETILGAEISELGVRTGLEVNSFGVTCKFFLYCPGRMRTPHSPTNKTLTITVVFVAQVFGFDSTEERGIHGGGRFCW